MPWTPADAALVDEARHLLGPRNGGADDGVRKYGHIVVDEVQDLSPMQLRMLTRRSLSGSMTVVGDIAQATAPWAPTSWADITEHLPRRRPIRDGGAHGELPHARPRCWRSPDGCWRWPLPSSRRPRPVRRTGVEPRMVAVRDPSGSTGDGADAIGDLARQVAEVAAEEVAAVAPGRVAIARARRAGPLAVRRRWRAAGLPAVDARRPGARAACSSPSCCSPPRRANGLEFDSVVVVEPGVIAGETARGPADSLRGADPPDPAADRRLRDAASGRAHGGRLTAAARRARRARASARSRDHSGGCPAGPDRRDRTLRRGAMCLVGGRSRPVSRVGPRPNGSTKNTAVTQAIAVDPAPSRQRHRPDRPSMLAVGVMIWLGSEVMFFSSLFAAFFTIRAHAAVWPPTGTHLDTIRAGIFTLVLVSSSFTMQKAVFDQETGNRTQRQDLVVRHLRPRGAVRGQPVLRVDHALAQPGHRPDRHRLRLALLHHVGPPRPARHARPGGHALPARAGSRARRATRGRRPSSRA